MRPLLFALAALILLTTQASALPGLYGPEPPGAMPCPDDAATIAPSDAAALVTLDWGTWTWFAADVETRAVSVQPVTADLDLYVYVHGDDGACHQVARSATPGPYAENVLLPLDGFVLIHCPWEDPSPVAAAGPSVPEEPAQGLLHASGNATKS